MKAGGTSRWTPRSAEKEHLSKAGKHRPPIQSRRWVSEALCLCKVDAGVRGAGFNSRSAQASRASTGRIRRRGTQWRDLAFLHKPCAAAVSIAMVLPLANESHTFGRFVGC